MYIEMCSDVYEFICCRLDVMIGITRHYIFILACVIVTFIQGHRGARKRKLLCRLSDKLLNQFKWNWSAVQTYETDERHTLFMLSRERNWDVVDNKEVNHLLGFRHLQTSFV